ncbi:MAG: CAP domain-containing protein [Planctomycetota bacterium]
MLRELTYKFAFSLLVAVIAVGISGCADNSSTEAYVPLTQDLETDESTMVAGVLQEINSEREACLLMPLEWDDSLAEVAREYAMCMANNNRLDHYDMLGRGLIYRLENAQIVFIHAGENIARGYTSPEEVVNGWMASDDHRNNILCPEFTQTGIALAGPGPYWVQVFIGQ